MEPRRYTLKTKTIETVVVDDDGGGGGGGGDDDDPATPR